MRIIKKRSKIVTSLLNSPKVQKCCQIWPHWSEPKRLIREGFLEIWGWILFLLLDFQSIAEAEAAEGEARHSLEDLMCTRLIKRTTMGELYSLYGVKTVQWLLISKYGSQELFFKWATVYFCSNQTAFSRNTERFSGIRTRIVGL